MLLLTTAAAILAGAIAMLALWQNPKRLINRIVSILSLIIICWLYCILQIANAASIGASGIINLLIWIRLNVIVVAFVPWGIALLTEAIQYEAQPDRRTPFKTFPWFAATVALIVLALHPSLVELSDDSRTRRGTAYLAYTIVSLLAYASLIITTLRRLRKAKGVTLLELKFLALTGAGTGALIVTLNFAGRTFDIRALNRATIPLGVAGYAISVGVLTAHHVFETRHIFLRVARQIVLLGLLVVATLSAAAFMEATFETTIIQATTITICGAFVLWLDKQTIRWIDSERIETLESYKRELIEAAIHESADRLLQVFEQILCRQFSSTSATVVSYDNSVAPDTFFAGSDGAQTLTLLHELDWITPETLRRRRQTPQTLVAHRFMSERNLAVIGLTPKGVRQPSLMVALGSRPGGNPFTYQDIEQLQRLAELMDSVTARAKLVAQQALQAKMEHLAMLSRGLAHDLKNLITPISSFFVHTEGTYPPGSAEAEVHSAARRSVQIMNDYFRETLFFSEYLVPKIERILVSVVVDGVQAATSHRAGLRHVSLGIESTSVASIHADRVLLQRMLANLVNNALDASKPGQTVLLRASNPARNTIRFEVIDSGVGIAEENLERIFDPYFTTKQFGDEVRGFGLGLTICQKIVNLHSGTIRVESKVGCGTSVTVEIPIFPPPDILPSAPCLALP